MNDNFRPKYACEGIVEGVHRERALELLIASCNQPSTLFITDTWVAPRLDCYVLGGCVIGSDSHRWWCRQCDVGFGNHSDLQLDVR